MARIFETVILLFSSKYLNGQRYQRSSWNRHYRYWIRNWRNGCCTWLGLKWPEGSCPWGQRLHWRQTKIHTCQAPRQSSLQFRVRSELDSWKFWKKPYHSAFEKNWGSQIYWNWRWRHVHLRWKWQISRWESRQIMGLIRKDHRKTWQIWRSFCIRCYKKDQPFKDRKQVFYVSCCQWHRILNVGHVGRSFRRMGSGWWGLWRGGLFDNQSLSSLCRAPFKTLNVESSLESQSSGGPIKWIELFFSHMFERRCLSSQEDHHRSSTWSFEK